MDTDALLKRYPSMAGGETESVQPDEDMAVQRSEEELERLKRLYPKTYGSLPDSTVRDRRTDQAINEESANYHTKKEALENSPHQTFRNADLSNERLYRAELGRKSFDEADFSGAVLTGGSLHFGSAENADFTDAEITEVDFTGCDLRGADLSKAKGTQVDLSVARIDSETKLPSEEYMKKHGWKL